MFQLHSMRISLLAALSVASMSSAQQFLPAVERGLYPSTGGPASGAVFADFNGNGRPDVLAQYAGLFLNEPDGTVLFEPVPFFGGTTESSAPSAVAEDFDGDGDIDIAWVGIDTVAYLSSNDGTGSFTHALLPFPEFALRTPTIVTADFDGDGDIDLLAASNNAQAPSQPGLLLNDGTGSFTDVTATQVNVAPAIVGGLAVGDIDGDGDLDLFAASASQGAIDSTFWMNDGSGHLTDGSGGGLPLLANRRSATLLDIDADGDPDLITAGQIGILFQEQVFENDGTGQFTDVTALRFIGGATAWSNAPYVPVDLDGDGDLDLLGTSLRINDGTNVYTTVGVPYSGPGFGADVDLDGDVDIWANHRIYANDGQANFEDRTASPRYPRFESDGSLRLGTPPDVVNPFIAELLGLRAADLDHDGDLDFLRLPNPSVFPVTLGIAYLVNDGSGTFATEDLGPTFTYAPSDVSFGDVDGDGDTDVVLSFGFSSSTFVDFNDAAAQTKLFLNDGSGVLTDVTATQLPVDTDSTYHVELADVDADGDLDLLLGNGIVGSIFLVNVQNRLWLNDGSGAFTDVTATHLPAIAKTTRGVSVVDIDLDGDLDLTLAEVEIAQGSVQASVDVLTNDGSGVFGGPVPLPVGSDATEVAFVDLDRDGDQDAFWSDGVGPGRFSRRAPSGFVEEPVVALGLPTIPPNFLPRIGDFDGDGDADVVYDPDRIFLNRHQHIEAPGLPRIGSEYTLRIHASPGYAAGIPLAVPIVGFASASLSTPFGALWLDPTSATALTPALLPLFGGTADVTLDVPNSPSIVDVDVFFQALVLDIATSTSTPRFTNLIADRVLGG